MLVFRGLRLTVGGHGTMRARDARACRFSLRFENPVLDWREVGRFGRCWLARR